MNTAEIDVLFTKILSKCYRLKSLKPINEASEKAMFLKNQTNINPLFEYSPPVDTAQKLKAELLDISIDDQLYIDAINEYNTYLDQVISIGDTTFTQHSIDMYGTPKSNIISIAKNILNIEEISETKQETELLNLEQIIPIIENALEFYKIESKIVVKDNQHKSNRLAVGRTNGKIYIHKDIQRTKESLNGSIAHEIGCHLTRLRNGKKQVHGIFGIGTAKYLMTEEGLATLMGYSQSTNKLMKRTSTYIILMDIALSHDFKTVYEAAYDYTHDKAESWYFTLRVKRGISNTNEPGAFTKDQYLQWAIELGRELVKSPNKIDYLLNGKGHLDYLEQYTKPNPILKKEDFLIDIENIFSKNSILF